MTGEQVQVMFLGLGIVFVVLAIIYGIMVLMNVVASALEKKNSEPTAVQAAPVFPADMDEETAAAIAAAVACCMGAAPGMIRIDSVTEIPAWQPRFMNTDGGNRNEKLYNKDKWKTI